MDAKAVRALTYAQAHALRNRHESVTCGVVARWENHGGALEVDVSERNNGGALQGGQPGTRARIRSHKDELC